MPFPEVDRLRSAVETLIARKTEPDSNKQELEANVEQLHKDLTELAEKVESAISVDQVNDTASSMSATDELIPSNLETQTLQHVEGGTGTVETETKIPS